MYMYIHTHTTKTLAIIKVLKKLTYVVYTFLNIRYMCIVYVLNISIYVCGFIDEKIFLYNCIFSCMHICMYIYRYMCSDPAT